MKNLRRAGLTIAAQGLYSSGQLCVTLAGTLALPAAEWGRVAMLLSFMFIAGSAVRGFGALPVLVYHSGDAMRADSARRPALAVAIACSVLPACCLVVFGASIGATATGWILAGALVGHCAYDSVRSSTLAATKSRVLLLSDAVVLSVLAGGAAASFAARADAAVILPAGMCLAYMVGTITAVVARRTPRAQSIQDYFLEHWRDMPFLAADSALLGATTGILVLLVGAVSSVGDAGAFRAASSLFGGPLQMLQAGIAPLIVRAQRRHAGTHARLPGEDRRSRTVKAPLLSLALTLAMGAMVGAVTSLLAQALVPAESSVTPAVALALPSCVLVAALAGSSICSGFLRYRRSNAELTALRVATLALSTAVFLVVHVFVGLELSYAILAATIPWVVLPPLHLIIRWAPVARALAKTS